MLLTLLWLRANKFAPILWTARSRIVFVLAKARNIKFSEESQICFTHQQQGFSLLRQSLIISFQTINSMKLSSIFLLSLLAMVSSLCAGFNSHQPLPATRRQQSTYLASHAIGQEKVNTETIGSMQSLEQQGEAAMEDHEENHPVDFALLLSMASLTALATMAWVATDSTLVQNLEDDGSSATLIVDGVFGAVATIASFISGDK